MIRYSEMDFDVTVEISQGGVDTAAVMIYFHAALLRGREQLPSEVSFETRALARITKLLSDAWRPANVVRGD